MRGGDRETQRRLDALGGLASRGIEVLQGDDSGRLEELGDLCWRAGDLLAELGLMTPELARLLEEGRACGAVGGKVSGAGGGGAFFLLFRGPEEAAAAAPRLRWLARSLGLSTAESIRTFSRPTSEGGAT
jgi:mevalonate kinase